MSDIAMVTVSWFVAAVTQPGEYVFLVGDCSLLGDWTPDNAIILTKTDKKTDDGRHIWTTSLQLNGQSAVKYRYFIAKTPQTEDEAVDSGGSSTKHILIQSWEGGLRPRVLDMHSSCGSSYAQEDVFGVLDSQSVDYQGWLTTQTELRLHFYHSPVSGFNSKDKNKQYRIRCDAVDLSQEFSDENAYINNLFEEMQYVDLLSSRSSYATQSPYGALVTDKSYLMFRTQTVIPQHLGIKVSVYSHTAAYADDGPHDLLGHSVILPSNLAENSAGSLLLPIQGKDSRITGQIKVEFLVIKPLKSYQNTLVASSAKVWNHGQPALDMGHRGMGKCRSVQTPPFLLENTVKSFNTAHNHGADYVEFDVQLTKDFVPVVFHDFLCRLHCNQEEDHEDHDAHDKWHDPPVQDLTYKQLLKLQANFAVETGTSEKVEKNSENSAPDETARLFQTLSEVLEKVNPDIGFNIEIKYPLRLQTGELEDGLKTFMDMNLNLDTLLDTMMQKAGNRKIVMSCFNPDVCTMIKLKQNRFPVLFLTQGCTARYELFAEPRALDVHMALRFAKAEGFLGVNPISEYILNDPSLMALARDLDLVIMCWGSENNDIVVIKKLKALGVHVVIYDRLNEFIADSKSQT